LGTNKSLFISTQDQKNPTTGNSSSQQAFSKIQSKFKKTDKERTDWVKAKSKYLQGLRDADVSHVPTTQKNSFLALFSTEPTRRLDRSFKKRDIHITKRSNFNVRIDSQSPKPLLNKQENSLKKLSTLQIRNSRLAPLDQSNDHQL